MSDDGHDGPRARNARPRRGLLSKKTPVVAVVRCRPTLTSIGEVESSSIEVGRRHVSVATQSRLQAKRFVFNHVHGPAATQRDVFTISVAPLVDDVLESFNSTVFAYGSTSSGKTFTIEGGRDDRGHFTEPGMIPLCVNYIFQRMTALGVHFTVKIQVVELYKEEIFDLLGAPTPSDRPPATPHRFDPRQSSTMSAAAAAAQRLSQKRLRILEDGDGHVSVRGAVDRMIETEADVWELLKLVNERRRIASTKLNARSSRSHVITTIIVHQTEKKADGEELVKTGKLNLVDLAGSENIRKSGALDNKDRSREAGKINRSLLTLGRVIEALSGRSSHVPYRDSKLTTFLKDSLGGRHKTLIIATISKSAKFLDETSNTLHYASLAKRIENSPTQNQKVTQTKRLAELELIRRELLAQLDVQRRADGVARLSLEEFEEYERSKTELAELRKSFERVLTDHEELRTEHAALTQTHTAEREASALKSKKLAAANEKNRKILDGAAQVQKNVELLQSDNKKLFEAVDLLRKREKETVDAVGRNASRRKAKLKEWETKLQKHADATRSTVQKMRNETIPAYREGFGKGMKKIEGAASSLTTIDPRLEEMNELLEKARAPARHVRDVVLPQRTDKLNETLQKLDKDVTGFQKDSAAATGILETQLTGLWDTFGAPNADVRLVGRAMLEDFSQSSEKDLAKLNGQLEESKKAAEEAQAAVEAAEEASKRERARQKAEFDKAWEEARKNLQKEVQERKARVEAIMRERLERLEEERKRMEKEKREHLERIDSEEAARKKRLRELLRSSLRRITRSDEGQHAAVEREKKTMEIVQRRFAQELAVSGELLQRQRRLREQLAQGDKKHSEALMSHITNFNQQLTEVAKMAEDLPEGIRTTYIEGEDGLQQGLADLRRAAEKELDAQGKALDLEFPKYQTSWREDTKVSADEHAEGVLEVRHEFGESTESSSTTFGGMAEQTDGLSDELLPELSELAEDDVEPPPPADLGLPPSNREVQTATYLAKALDRHGRRKRKRGSSGQSSSGSSSSESGSDADEKARKPKKRKLTPEGSE